MEFESKDLKTRVVIIKIQVLYFKGCPNHPPAVALVKQVVSELGLDVAVEEVEVQTPEDAVRLRFLGSPSVQVNGIDIDPSVRSRTDYAYSCRTYGGTGLPPRELIVAALSG